MFNASVKEFNKIWWREVFNRLIGAAVFLDDATAECLHWEGGLISLLTNGAVSVRCLSPFESAEKDHKKGVFLTQATAVQLQTIREIIANSDFSHCIILSSTPLDVLYLDFNEGRDVSDVMVSGRASHEGGKQLQAILKEWMGKEYCAAEVIHIPLFTVAVTNTIFVTPPLHKVYPTFNGKLIPQQNMDLYVLTSEERSNVRRLAGCLNTMFDSFNIMEDVFHMGAYSALVAGVLDNSPTSLNRRKTCTKPASLILVDRTVDLCSVTSHASETVLDKIMSVLPRFPGHVTDVCVDMSPLCEAPFIPSSEEPQTCPGCLGHPEDESCCQTLEYMISKSQKDVLFHIYNSLAKIETPRSPGPKSPKNLLRVTPQGIEKIIKSFQGNYEWIDANSGLLQQALAVVQMLKGPEYKEAELLAGFEKQVLQNITTSGDSTSILEQISSFLYSRHNRSLSVERLLTLLVHIYSVVGTDITFSPHHEDDIHVNLSVAVFEDHKSLPFWNFPNDRMTTPEVCDAITKNVMLKLKEVALTKKLLANNNGSNQHTIQRLIEAVVDPTRPPIPNLKHRQEGFRDMLRTGFNLLTSKKPKPKHPMDNPVLFVFVIGGITAEECRNIHRTVLSSGQDVKLLVGSTRLVSPVEATRQVLNIEK